MTTGSTAGLSALDSEFAPPDTRLACKHLTSAGTPLVTSAYDSPVSSWTLDLTWTHKERT